MTRSIWILSLTLLAHAVGPTHEAQSHEAVDVQIREITRGIESSPQDARSYVARGELFRLHGDWHAAERDYAMAARLDPALVEIELCRARMDLDRGRPEATRRRVEGLLAARADELETPTRVMALTLRAHALERLDRPLDAVGSLDEVVAHDPKTSPDVLLWRSRLLIKEGRLEHALSGLDAATRRLGPVVSIEFAALDLEVELGRYPEALDRIDRLQGRLPLRGTLCARRGAVLERAGQRQAARAAYEAALAAIEELPSGRRSTSMVRDLENTLHEAMERLR